ncbi:alanine racemase [Fulvimarina pelagi]|uniref:alanine racemase n=1 Tax=Fulvimarina pelagi TaxID=217511 RepID=UPI00058C9523|nr:alanine racemase [Fulvimarina pelagi]
MHELEGSLLRQFERLPRVEIDRGALKRNWAALASIHPNAQTGAAVKADGYGLGAVEVSRALFEAGCRNFFVAWPEEGQIVRSALAPKNKNARVFVLQGMEPAAVRFLTDHDLVPVLSSPDDLTIWTEGLTALARRAPAALQLETGMNRLGLDERGLGKAMALVEAGELEVALLLTHLASADVSPEDSEAQRIRFSAMSARFPYISRSLANSAGLVCGESFGLDLTRPGIALYGGMGCLGGLIATEPVARLSAAVIQVREVEAGEKVGYAGAARLTRRTIIATLGIGYGDGYLRALSGAGVPLRMDRPAASAVISGCAVPVLGRISMDLTLLDVTDLPAGSVRPGDRAELFGPNMPIDKVAEAAGTIPYELLTGLGPRVQRVWRN